MQRISQKTRDEFMSTLYEHADPEFGQTDRLEVIYRAGTLILRHGTTYARIQEMWCNVEMSDRVTAYWELREKRLEICISTLARSIGCIADFSGDPRGNTVTMIMPDGYTNNWGRTGVSVPTS